ncbi:MMS19 nucleotide excision repair protein-like [Homarus americanus]|uniref:MMS19 nucleotide excision repair protein n=1 Tax=Homarus americanus TaxID=6706 RepID=A0A8J5MUM5_HOMAM|nr:MMS19 nucleotide excision repair protein-like [Homarus americanus]
MTPSKTLLERLDKLPNSSQEAESIIQDIIPELYTGDLSVCHVVDALGPSLTHANPSERGAGTRFLADLLHSLPCDKLSSQELLFLTAFFLDRLKDHHSVIPNVIYANIALVKQKHINRKDVTSLVQGLFREVPCQSQIMSDRRNIYTLLKYCLVYKLEDIREMGQDFVLGFVTAMDGEKDPRNLVLLFTLVPIIVKNFPLGPFTEDLFEVVAAYFPIDFVPPADDPYGISSEDLVLGLRGALAATPQFAPYCIPLLQEKLDSDLTSAKLDSLHTMVACCEVYSAEDISPHVLSLWASIRREIVEGASSEMEAAALSTLSAIVMTLQRGILSQAAHDATNTLTKSALMECMGHLTAPEQRLMFPSAHILLALVVAAQVPAQTICETVVPVLTEQFGTRTEAIAKKNTIIILGKFLNSGSKFPDLKTVQEATVLALTAALPAFHSSYLSSVAQSLTKLLLTAKNDSLRDGIIQCFVALGKIQPLAVSDHILPKLLIEMEQGHSVNSGVSNSRILETLAILTAGRLLTSRVLPVVWRRAEDFSSLSSEQCCQHLSCVRKILRNAVTDSECKSYVLEEWSGVMKVVCLSVSTILSPHVTKPVPILQCLSSICRILVANLSEPQPLVQSLLTLVTVDEAERVEGVFGDLVVTLPETRNLISSIADESHPQAPLMSYMIEGVVLGARQLPETDGLQHLLRKLRRLSLCHVDLEIRETSAILHGAIINKIPTGPSLTQALSESREELFKLLNLTNQVEKQKAALLTLTWVCKALVVRGAQDQDVWTTKMQNLLSDSGIGLDAAHSFEVILREHQYALRPETFANIRLLYKQRYFEIMVGPLVDMFHSSEGNTKHNALLALSSLMPSLPHLVLNNHIKKLLPVLLQGITSGESAVTESTVCTLSSLLQHSLTHAAPHTNMLVSTLVPLTVNHPMMVRMKALECLQALTALPTMTILPYREDVIRGLKCVLNDKKRVVRQVATNARCSWILVGAPGSESA